MSYKTPRSSSIVCNARLAVAATNDTLSAVTFNNVDFGSQYFQGSAPYTGFICPAPGIYEFRVSGWDCGGSTPGVQVTSTRSASIIYDQFWGLSGACTSFHDHWYVPNCQAGDIVTFHAVENTAGSPIITSITNNTRQSQGNFVAIYWQQF